MVMELERRFNFRQHSGVVRLLAYVNRAHMGSYATQLTTLFGRRTSPQARLPLQIRRMPQR